MERVLWIVTMIGVGFGALVFVEALTENSAPRQAAGAGLALCCAVIPYVLARAVRGFKTAGGTHVSHAASQSVADLAFSAPRPQHRTLRLTRPGAAGEDSATDPGV
jgi:hypothetical protein